MDPKPRSHSHVSKLSTDSISLLNENRLSSSSFSSEQDNGKPEVVRRIAGKKISALFEVGPDLNNLHTFNVRCNALKYFFIDSFSFFIFLLGETS